MGKWYLFFLAFIIFTAGSSHAQDPKSNYYQLCLNRPKVCAALNHPKEKIENFISALERRTTGVLPESIDLFKGMTDTETLDFVNRSLLAFQGNHPNLRSMDFIEWFNFSVQHLGERLNLEDISEDEDNEVQDVADTESKRAHFESEVSDFIKAVSHLDEADWNTLIQHVIYEQDEYGFTIPSPINHSFAYLTKQLVVAPEELSHQIQAWRLIENRKNGAAFLSSLSKGELTHLVQITLGKPVSEVIYEWTNAHVNYLSDLKNPKLFWTLPQLYRQKFLPRGILKYGNRNRLYEFQENDVDKWARVAYEPKIGKAMYIEGKIIGFSESGIELIDRTGEAHTFSRKDGNFLFFFVRETSSTLTFSDFVSQLKRVARQLDKNATICNLFLIGEAL